MDFLDFDNVSFLPNSSIGRLCEDLNNIAGHVIWYNTFEVQNTVVMVSERYCYEPEQ